MPYSRLKIIIPENLSKDAIIKISFYGLTFSDDWLADSADQNQPAFAGGLIFFFKTQVYQNE